MGPAYDFPPFFRLICNLRVIKVITLMHVNYRWCIDPSFGLGREEVNGGEGEREKNRGIGLDGVTLTY